MKERRFGTAEFVIPTRLKRDPSALLRFAQDGIHFAPHHRA